MLCCSSMTAERLISLPLTTATTGSSPAASTGRAKLVVRAAASTRARGERTVIVTDPYSKPDPRRIRLMSSTLALSITARVIQEYEGNVVLPLKRRALVFPGAPWKVDTAHLRLYL